MEAALAAAGRTGGPGAPPGRVRRRDEPRRDPLLAGNAEPDEPVDGRGRAFRVADVGEAVLRVGAAIERRRAPRTRALELSVDVKGQLEAHGRLALPDELVHQVVGHHDQRASDANARRDAARSHFGVGPARAPALVVRAEDAVRAMLRASVHERRVVREGASIPVETRVDVGARSHVVEPPLAAYGEEQVQPIGVPMSATGVAVVECGVHLSGAAPKDRVALPLEERGPGRDRLQRREHRSREQQRAPSQIGARERRRGLVALGFGRRAPAAGVAARIGPLVELVQGADEARVAGAHEPELARLGEAPLSKRDRVLRVPARGEGEIGECRGERGCVPLVEPPDERGRQLHAGAPRQRHAVPEPTMGEEVIVLAFEPGSVGEQPGREVREDAPPSHDRALGARSVIEQQARGNERRVVPDLAIGAALVVGGDERAARLDDPLAHARGELAGRARELEEVERDAEVQQPDRFEVRAEERARRPEHVVAIGVLEVALDPAIEDRAGERRQALVRHERAQRGGVHRTLGEPELIPGDPGAVVPRALVRRVARRTPVQAREEGIERQLRAVAHAAAAVARQERLLPRNVGGATEERLEIAAEGGGEGMQRTFRRPASPLERLGREQQRHGASATLRDPSTCHREMDTSSPRRSIVTPASRRRTPSTPREW